ncbi:uncharacterized protein LOC143066887 isoform X5 [Mytilus galloprovincialis]|uniref:uncharacterized protein LOC143066887 isoform X5 n=1 Tax=Mytilus galloprovincialis TaxID=29158 RepID=UPI003F7B63E0
MESWFKAQFEEFGQDLKNEIREQHIATVTDLKMFVERKLAKEKEAKEREIKEDAISDQEEISAYNSEEEEGKTSEHMDENEEQEFSEMYPASLVFGRKKKKNIAENDSWLRHILSQVEPQPSVSDILTAASKVMKRKSSQFSPASSIPGFKSVASGSGLQSMRSSQVEHQPSVSDILIAASKVNKRKSSQGERQPTGNYQIQPSVFDVLNASSKAPKRKSRSNVVKTALKEMEGTSSKVDVQPSASCHSNSKVCFNKEQTKFVRSFAVKLNWTVNETALRTMISKGVQQGVFKEEEFTVSQIRDKVKNLRKQPLKHSL